MTLEELVESRKRSIKKKRLSEKQRKSGIMRWHPETTDRDELLEMSSGERDNDIVLEEILYEIGEESEKMIEYKRVSEKERY